MSNRAIAKVLGVSHQTVNDDLTGKNLPGEAASHIPEQGERAESGKNLPPSDGDNDAIDIDPADCTNPAILIEVKPMTNYDHAHQLRRKQLLAQLTDGTPCPICRRPMYHWQALDVDHSIPIALGGKDGPTRLAHARCNRRAGAKLGNRLRKRIRRGPPKRSKSLSRWTS